MATISTKRDGNMPLPPAFVIHSLAHAKAALAAAGELGVPVTLLSAPSAAAYAGPGWFRAVAAQACAAHPGVAVTAVLDCGDMAGHALAALREGVMAIRFAGDTAEKINDIAGQYGARVIAGRPEALDLAAVADRDMMTTCKAWLEKGANG
jgi:hypothetical protein